MGDVAPLIASLTFFGLVFVLPVVALMLRHQRSMAEILHRASSGVTEERIRALEEEVRELRAIQHRQIIEQDRSDVVPTLRA